MNEVPHAISVCLSAAYFSLECCQITIPLHSFSPFRRNAFTMNLITITRSGLGSVSFTGEAHGGFVGCKVACYLLIALAEADQQVCAYCPFPSRLPTTRC